MNLHIPIWFLWVAGGIGIIGLVMAFIWFSLILPFLKDFKM